MPWMYDVNNKAKGDSGVMSMAMWTGKDGVADYEHNARPRVGVAMRVGTLGSRSYSNQDYWTTTIIEEILEDTQDYVRFRTQSGSIYEWKT